MSVTADEKLGFVFKKFIDGIEGFDQNYKLDITDQEYFSFPLEPIANIENRLVSTQSHNVAYFSMEYGLAPSIYNSFKQNKPMNSKNRFFEHEVFSNYWISDYLFRIKIDKMLDIPIYGGGLGVLAGDAMKSSADLNYPVVGIGILWNKGYFKQSFWYKHGQVPEELKWDPYSYPGLVPLKNRVVVNTKEGDLVLRLWKYYVYSHDKKYACPIILLDSNLEENKGSFSRLTDQLYRSDDIWWKLFQRIILGIGGMKALNSLGYSISRYHLNEGHAAFAFIEKYIQLENKSDADKVKEQFAYTCHTPVAAGHDRFSIYDIERVLTEDYAKASILFGRESEQSHDINLTYMCLNNCAKVNAVAQKHGEITRLQFPRFTDKIESITNGVHLHTWISKSFSQLFDQYKDVFADWRENPQNLGRVKELAGNKDFRKDIFVAHQANKENLIRILNHWQMKSDILTIGWARRIAGYKRPALIFHNTEAILKIAKQYGPIQIVLAGKAHPNDNIGSAHIDAILDHIDQLNNHHQYVKVLILENYDTYFGKLLTNSVDVWLNNPLPPFEASGTSGMKAIINGVLQLTTLDGWVVEAAENNIGWVFGYQHSGNDIGSEANVRLEEDSGKLYQTLEEVAKLYYKTYNNDHLDLDSPWIDKMINCVERSSFFNTQRMMEQYKNKMW